MFFFLSDMSDMLGIKQFSKMKYSVDFTLIDSIHILIASRKSKWIFSQSLISEGYMVSCMKIFLISWICPDFQL